MHTVHAARASTILYGLLVNRHDARPWLLPANICPIIPTTFLKAQVPFSFVDISPQTLHMDLGQAEARIRKGGFGGLLYAHTYGETSTPQDFFHSIKETSPDLLIIDDRCLCVPDTTPDAASNADVQLYSTGYAKLVELDMGGYAFLDDNIAYHPVHLNFNPSDHDRIEASYKYAIMHRQSFVYEDRDWLDARTPLWDWPEYKARIESKLASSLEHRQSINTVYAVLLPEEIQLPDAYQCWRFNVRVKNKQTILDAIFSAGLFASSHYASLAGIMSDENAPHAEALADQVINLFNDNHFSLHQAERVCNTILRNLL